MSDTLTGFGEGMVIRLQVNGELVREITATEVSRQRGCRRRGESPGLRLPFAILCATNADDTALS